MLKSSKAFSAVEQKGQSNKVANQEAAKGSTDTEGNWNSYHAKELKHSYTKRSKIIGFFPLPIRKHLALPATCMCVLNKYSQRARIWRDFVVCTDWDRKAQGRSQLDHPLTDRAADGAGFPQPGETEGTQHWQPEKLIVWCYATTESQTEFYQQWSSSWGYRLMSSA